MTVIAVSPRARTFGLIGSSVVAVTATVQFAILILASRQFSARHVAWPWYPGMAIVAVAAWTCVWAWRTDRIALAAGLSWVAAFQPYLLSAMIVPMAVAFGTGSVVFRAILEARARADTRA